MSYQPENIRIVRDRFAARRVAAEREAEERREELHARCPEIGQIDTALAKTGMHIFGVACSSDQASVAGRLAALRQENEELIAARRELLASLGLPADYTSVRYACPACQDTGYLGTKMCDCMRRELVLEGFRSSGIGRLIERQSFDNFSLSYYSGEDLARMTSNLAAAKEFAEEAPPAYQNLLLIGNTGLGKTHLSTAVARRVIERGYDVRYESVQNILTAFETDRFHSERGSAPDENSRVFLSAELLIMDDLGTEMSNSFTNSCLYNLINTRINQGRATVISTNLEQKELRARYSDRVASRLFGEYRLLLFRGKDVRFQLK